MITEEQLAVLDTRVMAFIVCISSLKEDLFLRKVDEWTPRDIVAHLIGWNRYTIEGCQQMLLGETPSYFVDPGDDFSKVNAVSVEKYCSNSRSELINELKNTVGELKLFLLSLDPGKWDTDYGVRWRGGVVTIRNTVDGLIHDYIIHARQIEKWAESKKGSPEDGRGKAKAI
jgi:hypothetical protein